MIKLKSLLSVLFLFLVVSFVPVHAQGTITHVQSKIDKSATYVTKQSVKLTSSVTSGNLIVVAVSAYTGTNADITSVTDNKGNTYSRAIRNPAIANGQHHISIWYAKNVIGGTSFTVSATPAGSSYVTVAAHEYANASIDTVLDQTAGNTGSTTSATSSNTASTVEGNELVFGAFMHEAASNPAATAGTGFTIRQTLTNGTYEPLVTEDKISATPGIQAATLTWSTNIAWKGIVATFKSSSSLSPTPSISPTPSVTGTIPTPTLSPTATPTLTPTLTPTATATPTITVTPTLTPAVSVTPTATSTPQPTATLTPSPTVPTQTPTPSPTPVNAGILEPFEGAVNTWITARDVTGSGTITQSGTYFSGGANSARTNTASANSSAAIRVSFSDPASNHQWEERPGTFNWQRARLFVPSSTINQLSGNEYITLGGMWASSGGHAWYIRVKQGGQLFVAGNKQDGTPVEFNIFGTIPVDQWFDLEMGLHSQNGPGVKRAFAFALDGHFYGWYRQGRLDTETYDRAGYGILETNSADSLEVYVDDWYGRTTGNGPSGPDLRTADSLQTHNFLDGSGENVQLDWSTWQNDIRITNTAGIYSNSDRIQAGHNIDKMPDLTDGWAEIEIGWSGTTPPTTPNSYFGPMVGFHKEINREENLEVIPIGNGNGTVDLAFEAWTNGGPTIFARWPLPEASIGGGSHIPEPGDIIRTKWHMQDSSTISVQASYFDASSNQWYVDILNGSYPISNLSGAVNLNDGFHKASSVTIDTTYYSIRKYQVGTFDTYINPTGTVTTPVPTQTVTPTQAVSPTPTPTSAPSPTPTITSVPTPTTTPGTGTPQPQSLTRSISASEDDVNQDGTSLTTNSPTAWLGNGSSTTMSYTGLRFNNITIPRNAIITGAYLRVYSAQSQWLTINMNIAAEATANSGPFDANNLPSSKSLTAASVTHSSNTNWAGNTWYSLDDIKPVIQEVVNRYDWQSGNSLSIIMKGTSTGSWARKFIQSYDGSSVNAPQLVITYQ